MHVGDIGGTSTNEMFQSHALTTLLVLVLLAERVGTATAPTSSGNATVSPLPIPPTQLVLNIPKVSRDNRRSLGTNSTGSNLQCGFFEVPVVYHDSSAGTARLAEIKYAATVRGGCQVLQFR
jgi:hypothetical protein